MRIPFWRSGKGAPVEKAKVAARGCKAGGSRQGRAGGFRLRRPRSARDRAGAEPQAILDHRSDAAGAGGFARRRQPRSAALQIRSAHPDRRPRERVPAAQWRARRPAQRGRSGSRHQPGAVAAVARSRPRDHQEEQARRPARIRSGAAGPFAGEIAAGAVRHRPRSVQSHAGRARARCLFRPAHRLCRG